MFLLFFIFIRSVLLETLLQEHLDRAGTGWSGISCDDVTNGKLNKRAYFVIDPMQGDSYTRLVRDQSKIFGCGAIITSLTLKMQLVSDAIPKKNWAFGGLASLAMSGQTVCFTNIRKVSYLFLEKSSYFS